MAKKHSSKSRRARRNAPDPDAERGKPSYLSQHAIEVERRRLHQAESTLGCLVLSLQEGCEGNSYDDPDYSDVARAVRTIIRSVAEQLDIVTLMEADKRQVPDV